ncbi:hypothetical protein ZWY2020_029060 [Hordeum vulgare]|nr:hypothetical protein ZWY2020_029060 [Hordeum vulgare]
MHSRIRHIIAQATTRYARLQGSAIYCDKVKSCKGRLPRRAARCSSGSGETRARGGIDGENLGNHRMLTGACQGLANVPGNEGFPRPCIRSSCTLCPRRGGHGFDGVLCSFGAVANDISPTSRIGRVRWRSVRKIYMKRENAGSWNSGLEKEQIVETYSAQLQKS